MTQEGNTPPKRLGFVENGRKLAIGAVLLSSAVAAHAEPDVNKIPGVGKPSAAESRQQQERLKSVIMDAVKSGKAIPETEPRTDCVGDPNKRPVVNLFIGGASDHTKTSIGELSGEKVESVFNYVGHLTLSEKEKAAEGQVPGIREQLPCNQTNLYTTWDRPGAHKNYLENWAPPDALINIIGFSYGGDSAIGLAGELERKVNLLITLDPVVQLESSPPRHIPTVIDPSSHPPIGWQEKISKKMVAAKKNTTTWVNIYAEPPQDKRTGSDWIADMGGQYGERLNGIAHVFLRTRDSHADFRAMIGCQRLQKKDDKTSEELVIGKKITDCGGRE